MLTIREPQMTVFRDARVAAFINDMSGYLARAYPQQTARMGRAGTKEFVRRCVRSASALDIRLEGAIGALIERWLVYGERFERAPDREWAGNILAHPRLPDHVKVSAIQDRLDARSGGRVLVEYPAP